MRKIEIERQAIVRALASERNVTEAAKSLKTARRTLQSRMRDYGIPEGKSGRPRHVLTGSSSTTAVAVVAAIGAVVVGLYYGSRKGVRDSVVGGGVEPVFSSYWDALNNMGTVA